MTTTEKQGCTIRTLRRRGHTVLKTTSSSVALVALLVIGACSSPSPTDGPDKPDPIVPASVVVDPATALLVSVGDTVELSATVRSNASQPMDVAVIWSATPAGIVSVDADGRAVAVGNGQATVRASVQSAQSVSGSASVTVRQAVDSVELRGDLQAAGIGAALDSAVVVMLRDARGNPVVGAPVAFTVASGGGSVTPSAAVTGGDGSLGATWTLGPGIGIHELDVAAGFANEVTHRFLANAHALHATTLVLYAGDAQTEIPGADLVAPLQVQARDSLGNGVPDVLVTFAVSGDAQLELAEAYTDLDGIASVGLTLGSTPGTYTVTAAVPDSMTATGTPLAGSPVSLAAEAVAFDFVPPSGVTVGDTVTLAGSGFHPSLASNTVLIDGSAATVIAGSQTELTIEVPGFGCTPQRSMALAVSRAGAQASHAVTVTPADALALAVGERRVLDAAQASCLQFLSGSDDEYLVGLTATSWFDAGATFSMTGTDDTGPFAEPAVAASSRAVAVARTAASATSMSSTTLFDPEMRLREYERTLVARQGNRAGGGMFGATLAAVPIEGMVLDLRLPDLRGDPCVDFVPVTAEVFSVGARLALATSAALPDPQNPAIVVLLEAANTLHAAFGDTGIDLIMAFLGAPAGWDAESRVTVVLTPEVALMGVPAYASAVDQLPRTTCPSSNEGHYVYAAIPDAATLAELAAALAAAPPELAHHIAHVVQWTRRLSAGGNLLPSWLAEGQAEVVVEHVGLTLSGLGSQQDLGAAVLALPGVSDWIDARFERLALFQGWDGASGTLVGAPERCSLFGFGGTSSPCDPAAAPGAAWSFVRYLSDRFGPGGAGGEPGLHHAIIDLEPTADVVARIEAMLGVALPDLIVDWAAMLYVDGRLSGAQAPALQMTSWRLQEMLPAGPMRLAPTTFGFADFERSGTVVGGGTAYSLISSAGAHGPLALSVDDGAGRRIADVLRPRLWVVRMK